MDHTSLSGGLTDPAPQAAFAFRGIMNAMARPGRIEVITGGVGPAPLSQAAATALLVLCDPDTVVHLAPSHDNAAIRDWIAFHTGAPIGLAAQADFALGIWDDLLPLDRFRIGSPEYPDQSATLIVEMDEIAPQGASLTGPGIAKVASLSLPDIAPFQRNHQLFPLGVDFMFTAGDRIAALPRSTKVS